MVANSGNFCQKKGNGIAFVGVLFYFKSDCDAVLSGG